MFLRQTHDKQKIFKRILFLFLGGYSFLQGCFLVYLFTQYPQFPNTLSLSSDKDKSVNAGVKTQRSIQTQPVKINYKVVGYRMGKEKSSVILEKNKKQELLRIGEKLEGKYKLLEIGKKELLFDYKGQKLTIKNKLGDAYVP